MSDRLPLELGFGSLAWSLICFRRLCGEADPVNRIGSTGLFGFESFITGVGHTLAAAGTAFCAGVALAA